MKAHHAFMVMVVCAGMTAASAAEVPPGAASCTGCHAEKPNVDTPVPRLAEQDANAMVARFLKRADPRLNVTLVEPNPVFAACPFSNEVIASLRDMRAQLFGYDRIAAAGVVVVHQAATAVD